MAMTMMDVEDRSMVNVDRMLVSGPAVGRKNCVVLDGASGTIIPNDGPIADGMREVAEGVHETTPQGCGESHQDV